MEQMLLRSIKELRKQGYIVIIEELGTINAYIHIICNMSFFHINENLNDEQMLYHINIMRGVNAEGITIF